MTDTPMTPEYERRIRDHVAEMRNYSPGNLFARDLLAEVDRLRAALSDAADQVAERDNELGDVHAELDRLRREVEHHQDGKARWRSRAEKAEAATSTARAMHRKHADSDHCQYDDMTWPCPTVTALSETEAAELAEGQAQLDAMRADHPAPCRVPDSPDCTCPTSEMS